MSKEEKQLHDAIQSGDVKTIEQVINNQIHINSTLRSNKLYTITTEGTPLELALKYDQFNIAKLLLKKGANSNIWQAYNPLILCISQNQLELAKHLIQIGANTCRPHRYGTETPLSEAVKNGNIEIVQMLLDNGAEFTLQSGLVGAIEYNKLELLRLLLKRGVAINVDNERDISPLLRSLKVDQINFEIVNTLVQSGADVNFFHTVFDSPLTVSIDRNNFEVFEMLIKSGANINKANKEGLYPIIKAIAYGNRDMVKLLVENGANLNVKDSDGNTPFLKAVGMGDFLMIKCIVEQGIYLNQRGIYEKCALEIALSNLDFQTFKFLIESGADSDLASQSIGKMVEENPQFASYMKNMQTAKRKDITKGLSSQKEASTN